jgi:hypothetical protein
LSTEDVPIFCPEFPKKQLLERHNRGIPRSIYEPEISSKLKYPTSQYVLNQNLSESNNSFPNQLSIIFVPNGVQDADCALASAPVCCREIIFLKIRLHRDHAKVTSVI